jgi:hypothetical protein
MIMTRFPASIQVKLTAATRPGRPEMVLSLGIRYPRIQGFSVLYDPFPCVQGWVLA